MPTHARPRDRGGGCTRTWGPFVGAFSGAVGKVAPSRLPVSWGVTNPTPHSHQHLHLRVPHPLPLRAHAQVYPYLLSSTLFKVKGLGYYQGEQNGA